MLHRARRLLLAALLCVGSGGALSACGHSHSRQTFGDTEGTYLDLAGLKYQVQLSRQLNPADAEDRSYLVGLTPAQAQLTPEQAWFAVFVRVTNYSKSSLPAAPPANFRITDTQGNTYTPVPVNPSANPFLYEGGVLGTGGAPHGAIIPQTSTIASDAPTAGALLLYKVKIASYDNRPLILQIASPSDPTQTVAVDLDV